MQIGQFTIERKNAGVVKGMRIGYRCHGACLFARNESAEYPEYSGTL